MLHELRLFLFALQCLTRVQAPKWVGDAVETRQQCSRHFPGVGLLVGGFAAAVLALSAHVAPAMLAVLLSMAATAWMTGALAESGLASTADALGTPRSRAQALARLRRPRLGAHGVVALLLALAIKAASLQALALRDLETVLIALPLAHAGSRVVTVVLMHGLASLEDGGAEQPAPVGSLAMALAWALIAGFAAAWLGVPIDALLWMGLALLVTAWLAARWLRRRIGGRSAATLGAAQQVAECAAYLALLAAIVRG